MPEVGHLAPDFTLPNQDGEMITLSQLRGQKVIIFAFPKADTPGCTAQACAFRDNFPRVEDVNAIILGISTDSREDLKAWKLQLNLPYDLLSDEDHSMLEPWGAWGEFDYKERKYTGTMRSYWVINEEGQVIAGQVRIAPDESVLQALHAVAP